MKGDQHRQWIEAYLDETLTGEEFARFERALAESRALRAELREYLALDAGLRQGAVAGVELGVARGNLSNSRAPAMNAWVWGVAASVLILIGLGVVHQLASRGVLRARNEPDASGSRPRELIDDGVAILSFTADAVWEGEAPTDRSVLSTRKLALKSGLAEVQFYSGARLVLEGPAEVELVSAYRAICRSGRIRARVPEEAHGFTILTPSFTLVDLGTEFGLNLDESGEAQVRVFEGEVELRSGDRKQQLLGGQAFALDATGGSTPLANADEGGRFPSFAGMRSRAAERARDTLARWARWNESLANDPRVVARFDFENGSPERGTVVGCARAAGRWAGKGGLEFRGTGDRVRVNIPGEFDELTMSAWIRVDALPARRQALLLTDRYEVGHVHWQIGPDGELRFGSRVEERVEGSGVGSGYASPPLFNPRQIGLWCFVVTTYDLAAGEVIHYLNGREVSRHEIIYFEPLRIGLGDIGNWSVPNERRGHEAPLRNFTGRMDELTIWNTCLDADEIGNIHQLYQP